MPDTHNDTRRAFVKTATAAATTTVLARPVQEKLALFGGPKAVTFPSASILNLLSGPATARPKKKLLSGSSKAAAFTKKPRCSKKNGRNTPKFRTARPT
jgi:hypothetical protein